GGGLGDRSLGGCAVAHVASDRDAVDVDRDLGGGLGVDVENGDFRAGGGQHARRGGAESGAPPGDESRLSTNIHDQLACAVAPRPDPLRLAGEEREGATMTLADGGSA